MINYPRVSIVIATFNSEKTLPLTLASIKMQNFPVNKIEILVMDGGSTDGTVKLAQKNGCKVIFNKMRDPVPAKHLGFIRSRGDYIMYLDSDEVLNNKNSLALKMDIFLKHPEVKGITPSGYRAPTGYSQINSYINDFGDPFSYFIYGLPKGSDFYIKTLKNRYKKRYEDKNCVIFNFQRVKPLPIIELIALGSMIDAKYFRTKSSEIKDNPSMVAHSFYLLNQDGYSLAITKNDTVTHYSAETFSRYLRKINSRIKNNIYKNSMGIGGFIGRDKFQPQWFKFKKYLFIPYSFSLALPVIDSIGLLITRRKPIYLVHSFLCIYTSYLIIYFYILKLMKMKPKMQGYGA